MNFLTQYEDVEKVYGHTVAIHVVMINTINMTLKPKLKDIVHKGRFEKRMLKRFDTLHTLSDQERTQVINVWTAWHDFDMRREMQGLGGCEMKSLMECVELVIESKT